MIYTCVTGSNADLIKEVCSLYLKNTDNVADITFGRGAFWKKVKVRHLHESDINHKTHKFDFASLPYGDSMFDHVVFDPPYVHTPGKRFQKDNMYKNSATHLAEKSTEKYHKAVTQRYRVGICEAARIVKTGGLVWVKCQDEVCSGLQWWTHIEVYNEARKVGLYARDLFVLHQKNRPTVQHKRQLHARKNHSYLWIFEKPDVSKARTIARQGVP
jgi:hypothetical protein